MTNFMDLANPYITQLHPYKPGKPISELKRELGLSRVIKLASNENPLGPSPKAVAAAEASLKDCGLYPDPNGFELKSALSAHLNVDTDRLILANGSDALMPMLVQTFSRPGESVMMSEYGFAIYPVATQQHDRQLQVVKSRDWGHDLSAMADAVTDSTRIIFIANPNNPTGTYCTDKALTHLLEAISSDVLVVVDEAYYEFVNRLSDYPDTIALQQRHPNLITLRTFSKVYGLAGFRVGYGIAAPECIEILNRIRLSFNVASPSLAAATAALGDAQHVEKTLTNNHKGMQQMTETYERLGLPYIPSVTNFLTVDLGTSAAPYFERLLKKGLIVRPLPNYNMPNHLRISLGTMEENLALSEALAQTLEETA